MRYRVTLFVDPSLEFYSTARVYAGLWALHREQGIALECRLSETTCNRSMAPPVICLDVEKDSPQTRKRICIDLYDRSDLFNHESLARCDVYYKRSYSGPEARRCAGEQHNKVLPFGLNYACRCPRSMRGMARILRKHYLRQFLGSPFQSTRRWRDLLGAWKEYYSLPLVEAFEQGPEVPVDPVVCFQTRLWEPGDTTDDADAINRERVSLVRGLKKALPGRFHGGLVPTPLAIQRYPEELADRSSRRKDYVALGKRSLIGVDTRGLHYSTGFKFPEYLAASRCVVSQGLRNSLPVPLLPGRHYLPFTDPEECVAQCRTLLSDPDLATAMRRANHRYYEAEIKPSAHMRNCLERAFAPVLGAPVPVGPDTSNSNGRPTPLQPSDSRAFTDAHPGGDQPVSQSV